MKLEGVDYMCNKDKDRNNECQCLAEILTVINILQENSECDENCLDSCDRGFLGCSPVAIRCNTRPVILYNCCNGTPWQFPTTKEDVLCDTENVSCSRVLRVEKIDGCCATFRVLEANQDVTVSPAMPFVATNSFVTVNLNCVGAIRCLQDTFVDCI